MRNLPKLLVMLFVGLVIFSTLMLIVAILGGAPFLGCYMRYSDPSQFRSVTVTTQLNANGRYDGLTCSPSDPNCPTSGYGQWQRVALNVQQNAQLVLNINGQVSLCQAYTQDSSHTPIPRVAQQGSSDDNTLGVPIILPAGVNPITVANVYVNDLVQIRAGENSSASNVTVLNIANNLPVNANCSDGQTSYSPVCGKYSFYANYPYYASSSDCSEIRPSACIGFGGDSEHFGTLDQKCTHNGYTIVQSHIKGKGCGYFPCGGGGAPGSCANTYTDVCFKYNYSGMLAQSYTASYLFNQGDNIDQRSYYQPPFPSASNPVCPRVPSPVKSWFAIGQGLASAISYSIANSKYSTVNLLQDCSDQNNPDCQGYLKRYILNQQFNVSGPLNYQFYNVNTAASDYTGGYVFYLKQTKCYRANGQYFPPDSSGDTLDSRGQVQYLLLKDGNEDPNVNASLASSPTGIAFNNGQAVIDSAPTDGYLWLRIYNNPSDYQYSTGNYSLSITQNLGNPSKSEPDVWSWITSLFINKWQAVSQKMFQSMTCYGASDKTDCTNLFKMIQALLIAYLMLLGANFAIGAVRISQMDLLIRVLKVIVVAGLMNDNTFNFFNLYLFDLIFKATGEIMGSVLGVGSDLGSALSTYFGTIYNLLLSEIFQIQLLALLGTGLSGLILFLIVMLSLIFFLIPVCEFIVVYVLSSIAVAVLLSLAPLFLMAMLFDVTRYLFQNWLSFITRYIFEPIIMFVGICFLTQMFLIYIDYVLGYSVCWKCTLPFNLPFLDAFFPFLANLKTVPIFCIYWLAPWGYDAINYNFAMALGNVVALFMISFTALKYGQICGKICDSIFGGSSRFGSASDVAKQFNSSMVQGLEKIKSSGASSAKTKSSGGGSGDVVARSPVK